MIKSHNYNSGKIINDNKLFALIKEKIYTDNANAMLILVDLNYNLQTKINNKLIYLKNEV